MKTKREEYTLKKKEQVPNKNKIKFTGWQSTTVLFKFFKRIQQRGIELEVERI